MPVYQNATALPRQELTDFALEAANSASQFIGSVVLPPTPVLLPTGHYPKVTIQAGQQLRTSSKPRVPGDAFAQTVAQISDDTFTCTGDGFETRVPDEVEMTYQDYFSVEALYSKLAMENKMRQHEGDVAATLMNTGNFDANNSTVAYTAANKATISFVDDVIAAIRLVKSRGENPNSLVIPGPVYDRIRTATLLQSFIAGSVNPGARVTPDTITAAFSSMGIRQTLIGEGYVNTAAQGASPSLTQIWANTYVFVGDLSGGAMQTGGVGRTFFWSKVAPSPFFIESYRNEALKSNVLRAYAFKTQKITNTRAGTLITTQYS